MEHERAVNTGPRDRVLATDGVLDALLGVLARAPDAAGSMRDATAALVPSVGDGCVIDALDEEGKRSIAGSAHSDAARARVLAEAVDHALPAGKIPAPAWLDTALNSTRATVIAASGTQLGVPLHPEVLPDVEFDTRALLVVPLPYAGRTAGVLTLWRESETRGFSQAECAAIERAAPVLGAILHRRERAGADARARNELLSVVAHEVGTPLGTMQLHIESALRRYQSNDAVPAEWITSKLETTRHQSRKLARLLETVLHACQAEDSGPLALRRESVDLVDLVRSAVERQRDELAWAKCEVSFDAPTAAAGRWDPVRIEQVVTNLLSNAMKYGAGRPVSVRLEADEHGVRILVTDGGPGMDEAQQARLFARFERGESNGPSRGFGLGLWVVRTIAEAHGGSVSVASRPGAGSTFVVCLPTQ